MPKILGKFTPYDEAEKLLDGKYLDGHITGSNISASGALTAGSLIISGDQQIAGSVKLGNDISDTHHMTGSLSLSGSMIIRGQTTLEQYDIGNKALVIKGATSIVDQVIGAATQKAKLEIENLGSIGDRTDDSLVNVIDLGEGFQ